MSVCSENFSKLTKLLVFNNLSIKLRSISGTGKVGSVINFRMKLPKVIQSIDLIISTELTSTTVLGRLFQILTILLVNENFLRL